MKKTLIFILIVNCIMFSCLRISGADTGESISGPDIQAESAILIEATTGKVIYSKEPDKRLAPASITKIMTLILIFDAIENGSIALQDEVIVSAHAASMGGSQVFLEEGEKQTVETLIKCISIASANDASVAMAEHIAGSEEAFVSQMNIRALGLGMSNTNFVNCCGLDTDNHYTTAKDIATMSKELITKHPEIHNYSTIWMDTITHVTSRGSSDFVLSNTNKLLKQYEWATGLKTGSTGKAKFCLSATAQKDDLSLISVIMASPSGKTRVSDSITLLNYGFSIASFYKDKAMPALFDLKINKGTKGTLSLYYASDFSCLFTEKYDSQHIKKVMSLPDSLTAPVNKGDQVGTLEYYYNDRLIGKIPILAGESIDKCSYSHCLNALFYQLLP